MTKKGIVMKQHFILFQSAGVFYYEDTTTGKQLSLRTKNEAEASHCSTPRTNRSGNPS
jgi:hypothetical protein